MIVKTDFAKINPFPKIFIHKTWRVKLAIIFFSLYLLFVFWNWMVPNLNFLHFTSITFSELLNKTTFAEFEIFERCKTVLYFVSYLFFRNEILDISSWFGIIWIINIYVLFYLESVSLYFLKLATFRYLSVLETNSCFHIKCIK